MTTGSLECGLLDITRDGIPELLVYPFGYFGSSGTATYFIYDIFTGEKLGSIGGGISESWCEYYYSETDEILCQKVEVDTNLQMWYNMVNRIHGGMKMAEKQPSENIYNQIVKAYGECPSVQAISLVLGVSKMTVQRVLITEGLWESKRSREIVELARKGKTAEEIAKELFLSLKCVQNYMPYKRGMRQDCVTANAKIAKHKRERMRIALEGQRGKFASSSITDRIQMDENILRKEREQFENMMKNVDKLFDKESRPNTSAKKYIPSVLKLRFELVNEDGSCLSMSREYKYQLDIRNNGRQFEYRGIRI